MSHRTVTIWVCERCKAQQEIPGTGQPTMWRALHVVYPPLATNADVSGTFELCATCWETISYEIRMFAQKQADQPEEAS